MKKLATLSLVAAAGLGMAAPASAQNAVDYSQLTNAVDWSSAITGILAVSAVVAGVLVARKGIRFILAALK